MSAPSWRPESPFDELPNLLGRKDLETMAVLRVCIEARAAVAGLASACALIPSPEVLIGTLPLLEAQASSEIENIVTTVDDLFKHVRSDGRADPAVKEALRYRSALLEGAEQLGTRPLGTRTAEIVCSRIKQVEMSVRSTPGTTIMNTSSGEIVYTPPQGEARIRDLLSDWERFVHEPGPPDMLIRVAAAHYQFEAIHPFTDGNGRTGRVLMSLSLVEAGLLPYPVLYLSRYIVRNKGDYYRLLLDVTRSGAWEKWLLFMLVGIEQTARWTTSRIGAMQRLRQETIEHVRRTAPRVYTHELVEILFVNPYTQIDQLVAAGIATRQTSARYLRELVSVGVLREKKEGRDVRFLNWRLMDLLTREALEYAPLS